jgi:hypothetical protein
MRTKRAKPVARLAKVSLRCHPRQPNCAWYGNNTRQFSPVYIPVLLLHQRPNELLRLWSRRRGGAAARSAHVSVICAWLLLMVLWCPQGAGSQSAEACNDPAMDVSLGAPLTTTDGWFYTQEPTWTQTADCASAVALAPIPLAPLFRVPAAQMGSCLPIPSGSSSGIRSASDLQLWLGAEAGSGRAPWAAWGSHCVACDLGSGRIGDAVSRLVFYSHSGCHWRHSTEAQVFLQPGLCQRDGARGVAFRAGCDTAAVCPGPPLGGARIQQMNGDASMRCPRANRVYHLAVSGADLDRCLSRPASLPPPGATAFDPLTVFTAVPTDARSVRACCTASHLVLYYYADGACQQRLGGLPTLSALDDPTDLGPPRVGLELPLASCAKQTVDAGAVRPRASYSDQIRPDCCGRLKHERWLVQEAGAERLPGLSWYAASCTPSAAYGGTCPALLDTTSPTILCPTLHTATVDVTQVVLNDPLLASCIRNGTSTCLATASRNQQLRFASIRGGGVNNSWTALGLRMVDESDRIFVKPSFTHQGGEGIAFVTVMVLRNGANETVTNKTEFEIGSHTLYFEAVDRADDFLGQPSPNVASCEAHLDVEASLNAGIAVVCV